VHDQEIYRKPATSGLYRVKRSECYLVPSHAFDHTRANSECASDDDTDDPTNTHYMQGPPEPPDIPLEIMTPPCGQLPNSGPDLARTDMMTTPLVMKQTFLNRPVIHRIILSVSNLHVIDDFLPDSVIS
jgi:hypothetical protein